MNSTLPSNDLDLFLTGKTEVEKPRDPSTATPMQQWIMANGAIIRGPYGHILTEPPAAPVAVVRASGPKHVPGGDDFDEILKALLNRPQTAPVPPNE